MGALPFALLLLATGQRKYIIMPALTLVAAQLKLRSFYGVVLFFVVIFGGVFVFAYFGFLRENNYTVYDALDEHVFEYFAANLGQYLSGETPTLLATASSAYQGFMDPLPFFGDYLRAWQMSVPQLFAGLHDFSPANDRFAFAITPEFASVGGGWGYSFFAEAFMVGSYPGLFLATTAVVVLFRYLYRLALAGGRNSIFCALMVCGNYYAIWFERNSFAFFLKEYLIDQTVVTACVFALARAASLIRHRPAVRA
ncbi:MAG: O-antigen polysaccharide polymerase Wzy [Hyphomicrobiales bacterium]|nr:O-antigen polysaccharide polymerase Wzy [Hyphomicrobiales bacterium]